MTSKTRTVIIVAGGKGERMQQAIPKQFLPLHQQPLLMHTIRLFHRYDANFHIIVVLPAAQVSTWQQLCIQHNFLIPHEVVKGGESRFISVKNGLAASLDEGLIGVHDGVRPFAALETIEACFQKAEECGAAIPVIDAVESLRQLSENGSVAVDRTLFKLVQTPQVFDALLLKQAYQQDYSPFFTDDASVVEAFGCKVELVQGNPENIKITTPGDLIIAEALLKKE